MALLRQMMALCRNMSADDDQDEEDVNPPHPAHGYGIDVVGAGARYQVHRRARKFLRHALVALAAGGVEIGSD